MSVTACFLSFCVICVASCATQFVNFIHKMFVFLWDILLECYHHFEGYIHLINGQMLRRIV
jgi:hypothetical protein